MSNRSAPDECAICGTPIPRGAHACPECGADEQTGWREQSLYDGLDLPGDEDEENSSSGPTVLWKIIAVVLVILLAVLAFRHGW